MSRMDDELRKALTREEPSPQFTEGVMARVAALRAGSKPEQPKEPRSWWRSLARFFQPLQMKWAMAGVILCLSAIAVYGVLRYREDQRQRQHARAEIVEGERAKDEVMLAMKIASEKLNFAQRKVQEGIRNSYEGGKHE